MDIHRFLFRRKMLVKRKFTLEKSLEEIKEKVDRHNEVTDVIGRLRKGEDGHFFTERGTDRWMFVERYVTDTLSAPILAKLVGASIECVVIPEVIIDQKLHRLVQNPDGSDTMTPTLVSGQEIADLIVGSYARNVRLGTFDDVLFESCAVCGCGSMVICHHSWDHDNNSQRLRVYRLCLRCPDLQIIAGLVIDAHAPLTLLPPRVSPKSRP